MLDELVREALALDARRLWLEVRISNERAQALYRRYGFQRCRPAPRLLPRRRAGTRECARDEPRVEHRRHGAALEWPGLSASARCWVRWASRCGLPAAPADSDAAAPTPQRDPSRRAGTEAALPTAPRAAAVPAAPNAAPDAGRSARDIEIAALDWLPLRERVAACRACRLCEGRTQTVFGVGNQQAHCMIVGEAPGEKEDLQGEPFVGAAGQLLDRMLHAIGLTRAATEPAQQVYIANTLKCRPPRNRNPEPDELALCSAYLRRQIELVQPRLLLAMGRFAVQSAARQQRADRQAARPRAPLARAPGGGDLPPRVPAAQSCRQGARLGRSVPGGRTLALSMQASQPNDAAWEALPLPAIEIDVHGAVQRANLAFRALGAMPAGDALRWHEALDAESLARLKRRLQSKRDFSLELRWRRNLSELPAWVEFAATWMEGRQAYTCLLRDATAERLAERDARAETQRFALLADSVPALIAYYEAKRLSCVYANQQYARTFGLDPVSIIGRTFAEVVGAQAAAEIQPRVDRMLSHAEAASYERKLVAADGSPRWIEVSLVPHLDDGGAVVGAFVLISDITHHRRSRRRCARAKTGCRSSWTPASKASCSIATAWSPMSTWRWCRCSASRASAWSATASSISSHPSTRAVRKR